MTFDKFLSMVDKKFHVFEYELRYGQVLMNELYNIWPEKYQEVTAKDYDCYYNDNNINLVLDKLRKEWINNENI